MVFPPWCLFVCSVWFLVFFDIYIYLLCIVSVVILTPRLLDFNIVPVYGASDRILFYVLNLLTISS